METKNTPNPETMDKNMENPQVENAGQQTQSPLWKNVLVGGVPGILLGAAGMYAYEESLGAVPPIFSDPPLTDPDPPVEILEAHSVNDDMSFSEAFATARAEVGPGGAFVWHGQVYGTYRADDPEWIGMSSEERMEHSQEILSQVHPTPYTPTGDEPEIVEVPEPDDDSGHIHIYGIEQGINEDGELVTLGYGAVDGHLAALADTDGDALVDTYIVDENDNEMVDPGESHDVSGAGISVLDMTLAVEDDSFGTPDPDPDYTNDADAGNLC